MYATNVNTPQTSWTWRTINWDVTTDSANTITELKGIDMNCDYIPKWHTITQAQFEDLKQIEGYKDIYDARFELSKEDLTIRLKALAFDNGIVLGKKETKKFSKQSKKSLVIEPKQKNRVPSEWDSLIFRK